MPNWTYHKAIIDGEHFEIEGLNIWDHEWINTQEHISVKDPIYGEDHVMTVYQIAASGRTITFAAGEFSNMVWGIYLEG